jgi:SAM-dependent methyltransferase
MSSSATYDATYYDALHEGTQRSASVVVPYVLDLIAPRSVIDVGCGRGAWLQTFADHGIKEYVGVDGPWVDREALLIPLDRFIISDLERPFKLDRRFDLAVSLEVAEHLAPGAATTFVASLVGLSDTILFSAAIPGQEGDQHVNEQWSSYWVERFAQHEYVVIDGMRDPFWDHRDVEWWYAQNMLLFTHVDALQRHIGMERLHRSRHQVDCVHPHLHTAKLTEIASLRDRVAELTTWGETLARREADLHERVAELARWGKSLEAQIHDLETLRPGTVSLRQVLAALPALLRFAAMRRIK